MVNSSYQAYKEWEDFDFPIEISSLKFEKNFHQLGSACKIKVWRNEEYKLNASIEGFTTNSHLFDSPKISGPGNFAETDTITGYDELGTGLYRVDQCVVKGFSTQGIYYDGLGTPFKAEIIIDHFSRDFTELFDAPKITVSYHWFICGRLNLLWPNRTQRQKKSIYLKKRIGVDEEVKEDVRLSTAGSWDHLVIDNTLIKCIVAKVPDEFGPPWASRICFEYRGDSRNELDRETWEALQYFMGFILGTELLPIGKTFLDGESLVMQHACSPMGDVKGKCENSALPPIRFNKEYEWGKIDYLVNKFFPIYLENEPVLRLNDILWRFFQAKELTIGINLPVLSSAVEIIATNYIKKKSKIPFVYISQYEYLKLTQQEIENLSFKLKHIPDYQKMVNKFRSAFDRSGNEKLELFFNEINLPLGNIEKEAIRARNAMAHGGSDTKDEFKIKELITKTRAYETLFHRILLRILGYNDYYVDYYAEGHPLKKIEVPCG